jgi:Protein of unknown function (DUF2490)
MKKWLIVWWLFIFLMNTLFLFAQTSQKEINKQDQSWVSINTTARLSDKWGFIADIHERRNNFFKDPGFHFIRAGVDYWLKDNITIAAGYAHLWSAPTKPGWKTFTNENRIYQQVQMISKIGNVTLLQRLRNEQRWQQKISNDKPTGEHKFTNRVRYLLSFTIPVFKNDKYPSLVLSDELCVQFGKEIVYNTFDQNRLFIGVRQKVTKELNFDLGYMLLKQQKASGYQYDVNNTFRWFFYYTPDFRKKKIAAEK